MRAPVQKIGATFRRAFGKVWGLKINSWLAFLLGAGATLIVGAFVVPFLALTHHGDLPLERAFGNLAVNIVSRLKSEGSANPAAGDPRAVALGRQEFTGSCGVCHGAAGDGKGAWGQAMFPRATNLTKGDTQNKSDAQLFWIVKNGLGYTPMPAFKQQYTDHDIWSLVSYIRSLKRGEPDASPNTEAVPTPSSQQLSLADPHGNAVERGAGVYFAQGCHLCHGPIGDASGELGLSSGDGEAANAVRRGRRGMPVYGTGQITDIQLSDLRAYMNTLPGLQAGIPPGAFQRIS